MSSIKALKKKISKRAKQKKNIQVKNSIRLKQAKLAEANTTVDSSAVAATNTETTPAPITSPESV